MTLSYETLSEAIKARKQFGEQSHYALVGTWYVFEGINRSLNEQDTITRQQATQPPSAPINSGDTQ